MLDTGSEAPLDTLGSRIKAVRTGLKLRLGETANRIGVSRTSLGQWEADAVKKPDVDKLAAFTELTAVSLDWLVQGQGEPPPFLAASRRPVKPVVAAEGAEARTRINSAQQPVPEIVAALTAHAKALDLTPRAFWAVPQEVLELGFEVEAGHAVIKRVATRDGEDFGLRRGDYVLIDTSRNRIDEPGLYILPDPSGVSARRALVEMVDGQLKIVLLGDDAYRGSAQPVADEFTALGRVMGIFKPV